MYGVQRIDLDQQYQGQIRQSRSLLNTDLDELLTEIGEQRPNERNIEQVYVRQLKGLEDKAEAIGDTYDAAALSAQVLNYARELARPGVLPPDIPHFPYISLMLLELCMAENAMVIAETLRHNLTDAHDEMAWYRLHVDASLRNDSLDRVLDEYSGISLHGLNQQVFVMNADRTLTPVERRPIVRYHDLRRHHNSVMNRGQESVRTATGIFALFQNHWIDYIRTFDEDVRKDPAAKEFLRSIWKRNKTYLGSYKTDMETNILLGYVGLKDLFSSLF